MLKVMFVPVSIVFAVFFGIFSIKPEIMLTLAKTDELTVARETLSKTQERNGNILAQKVLIDQNSVESGFVDGYVPENKVSEKVLHEIHQFASESEVTLVNVTPAEKVKKAAVAPEVVVDPAALLADPTLAPLPSYAGEPDVFGFGVQIVGEYPKIRSFVDKIFRQNSMNAIQEMEIKRDDETATQSSMLQASLIVKYGYLPPVEIADGPFNYNDPVFNSKEVKFGPVGELKKIITTSTPALIVGSGEVGRDNPFVQ